MGAQAESLPLYYDDNDNNSSEYEEQDGVNTHKHTDTLTHTMIHRFKKNIKLDNSKPSNESYTYSHNRKGRD